MATKIKIAELAIDNKKLLSELQATKKTIEELSATQKELVKNGDTTSKSFIKNEADLKSLKKEYTAQSKVLQITVGATNKLNEALNKEIKSVDDATKANKELVQIRNQIDTSTKSGAKEINLINKQIDKNNDFIDDNIDKLGKQKKNIGNYQSALKGAKGALISFGGALKALGIGLIVAGVAKLTEAFGRNQKVANAVSTVFNAIGIVFDKVVGTIIDTVQAVSEANGGFDALRKVMGSLLTIALTPIKTAFFGIKLAVLQVQQAWEDSFFGGKDQDKILELQTKIDSTKDTLTEIGEEAIKSGKSIIDNVGEAFNEVTGAVGAVADGVSNIDFSNVIEDAKALTEIKNNAEALIIAQEGVVQSLERQAEKLRQLRDDESNSLEERKQFNEELAVLLESQASAERKLINQKLANAQKEASLNKGNIDLQNEVLRVKNEVLDVENRIEGQRSEQLANENSLRNETLTAIKDFENRKLELQNSIADKIIEDEALREEEKLQRDFEKQEREIETLQINEEQKTELLRLLEEDRLLQLQEIKNEANEKALEDKAIVDALEIKADEERTQALINNARNLSGLLSTILGESLAGRIASIVLEGALAVAQIKTNTAQANAQIVSNTQIANAKAVAATPLTGGLPFVAINSALGAKSIVANNLSAGLNIAKVIATSAVKGFSLPKAERGMLLSGARHSNGGINIEAEDGEAIINRNSTRRYLPLLSAINQDGGGVPFMANGGIAGSISSPNQSGVIDYDLLAQSISNMPAPIVSVEEISSVSNRVNVIESQSIL